MGSTTLARKKDGERKKEKEAEYDRVRGLRIVEGYRVGYVREVR